jgi:hypothetical protein
LENQITEGIQNALNLFRERVEKALKQQRKRDYAPKQTQQQESIGHISRACQDVCVQLRHIHSLIVTTLDGDNITTVLNEVATLSLDTLLKHIAKFTISQGEGSLALMRCVVFFRGLRLRLGLGLRLRLRLRLREQSILFV